jgi:peptidoglycan/LPS O-acetylase OafA/YrhL
MQRVEMLDWVRAFAVTLVVVFHAGGAILPGGAVGVSVFFVLSGYLIAAILMRTVSLDGARVAAFLVRRVLRIYPLFVLDVAVAVAIISWRRPEALELGLKAVPGLLTFTRWPDQFIGFGIGVLWTLLAEIWFYASFPVLAILGLRARTPLLVFGLAATLSFAAKVLDKQFFTLIYYDQFLIGAAVYVIVNAGAVPQWARRRAAAWLAVAIILAASAIPYPGLRNWAWFAQSFATALGAGLLVANLLSSPPAIRLPALAFIGRISYSIYFVHALLLDAWPMLAGNFLAYVTCVIAISSITYRFVERPGIALGRWLTRWSKPVALAYPGSSTASEMSRS